MPKRYTQKTLAESLYVLYEKIGRWPKPSDLTPGMACLSTFLRHFGSWDEAIYTAMNNAGKLPRGIVNLFTEAPIYFMTNKHIVNQSITSSGVARVKHQMIPANPPCQLAEKIGSTTYEVDRGLIELEVLTYSGLTRAFPQPREGTFLIVSRSVIYAATAIGRSTNDLLYPRDYERNLDGSITITGLRCIL